MADKESFRQRQESELEVIQAIFGSDVKDLRENAGAANNWRPLDLVITLLPQQGSSGHRETYTRTNLHVVCPSKYPKVPPKIYLEETKGLSDLEKNELLKQLQQTSEMHKGEVMIYDLAQLVQGFLHTHNKAPTGSFYDQMLIEKTKRDEALMKQQAQKLSHEQRVLRDEVLKRKEILRNEDRWRRDGRRSMSETSPTHRTSGSSEQFDMDSASGVFRERVYPNECDLHLSSEDLYFSNAGRKIRRGCCLGHSHKGCVAYSGIDSETGQLLYITEWTLKYAQLETKCTMNCQYESDKCSGHSIEEIIQCIEKQVNQLSQLRHRNLVAYECVLCMRKKEGVLVYLAQDFVLGTSVNSISRSLGWSYAGCSIIARGILDSLIFLHNKGVSHSNLDDCSVFMDNSSICRVTDFTLIPYLCYLNGAAQNTQGDLPALGTLIESLLQLPNPQMYDFIDRCKSERTLSASDLLEHPFLLPVNHTRPVDTQAIVMPTKTVDDLPMHASMTGHSRLQLEFEVQQWLGQGAYGDVLKVKNILDNRQYAIKRIPLTSRSRQIYKKMTREVELLSRLNHENVVRYFNSWIESATEADLTKYNAIGLDDDDNDESYDSGAADKQLCVVSKTEQTISDDEDDWMGISASNVHDSSSDGIQFVNSDGEVVELDDDESDSNSDVLNGRRSNTSYAKSPRHDVQIMYIQMEFCEKSTLRTAIDSNLCSNPERMWRLFREITEGLAHIHSQGMIHRDLKPVNIFLDSRDQVKIGDFGLATTSFLALQQCQEMNNLSHGNRTEIGSSLTGKVGTALYVAPELMGKASKSTYNQKVDLYSLGIIFFEMCHRPFETGMERVETLAALRSPNITIPSYMLNNPDCEQQVRVIKWLLNHDQNKRPTAEELLASDLMPPQRLEDNELQEVLRHVLANPQSKMYKHLVARCLAQQSDAVMELTYHFGLVQTNSKLELIKKKIVSLFRKHGGIELNTPLLSPYVKTTRNNAVRLMTTSGGVVVLPHDLRLPFIKHVAHNGIQLMRRYTVDRVYREKKGFNFHPKQLYECAFDIVTPSAEGRSHLVDAELISMAYELTHIIPAFNQRNLSFRVNHTSMLRAIMLHHNVPVDKYSDIFGAVLDFIDRRISKFQLHSIVTTMLETSKHSATTLIDVLLTEFQLGGPKGFYTNGSSLRSLVKGHSEASQLARSAMEEIEHVVSLAHGLGVMCTINFHAGFSIGFDRAKSGGIIWQLLGDFKAERKAPPYVLGVGGRYDYMLSEIQKQAPHRGITSTIKSISGAGLSFALDKILTVLTVCNVEDPPTVDVIVCVTGCRPNMREVTQILRAFWMCGIQCAFIESSSPEEGQDMAKELGAIYYVVYGDDGSLRLRSWINDKFEERMLNRDELIAHVKRMLGPESNPEPCSQLLPHNTNFSDSLTSIASRTNNSSKSNILAEQSLPNVDIIFITIEKMTTSTRRRYENVLTHHMTSSLLLFNRRQDINVLAVDLPPQVVRAVIGAIDPNVTNDKEISNEIAFAIDRYPDYKRYIKDIVEEVIDIYSEKKRSPIVCLYSLKDSYYRFIL